MSNEEQYNGWTNRETWAVALHINNDQGWQERVREALREAQWGDEDGYDRVTDLTSARETYADSPRTLHYRAGQIIRENVEDVLNPYDGDGTNATENVEIALERLQVAGDIGSLWRVDWTELGAAFLSDLEGQS